jgi:predicted RNase H-like nuclease (RuvC/YqgF family)
MIQYELKQSLLDKLEIEGLIERIQKLEKALALKELEVKTLTRELISFQHEYYKD